MSLGAPLIYAELLSNIRQISVIVALDVPCETGAYATLSADGQQFTFHHGGQITTLTLPGQAVSNSQLPKPTLGSKELSWRLPLAGHASRASIEDAQGNEAPWSAKDLSKDAEFACKFCRTVVLKRATIKEWKDLPSENWAEMMDFWHCHKPDVPASERDVDGSGRHVHDAEKVGESKGYGGSHKFSASTGVGLVDIITFLLFKSDVENLQHFVGYQEGGHSSLRDSVVWSPIQIPKINTSFLSCVSSGRLVYPLLRIMGDLSAGGILPLTFTPYLPQDAERRGDPHEGQPHEFAFPSTIPKPL